MKVFFEITTTSTVRQLKCKWKQRKENINRDLQQIYNFWPAHFAFFPVPIFTFNFSAVCAVLRGRVVRTAVPSKMYRHEVVAHIEVAVAHHSIALQQLIIRAQKTTMHLRRVRLHQHLNNVTLIGQFVRDILRIRRWEDEIRTGPRVEHLRIIIHTAAQVEARAIINWEHKHFPLLNFLMANRIIQILADLLDQPHTTAKLHRTVVISFPVNYLISAILGRFYTTGSADRYGELSTSADSSSFAHRVGQYSSSIGGGREDVFGSGGSFGDQQPALVNYSSSY